MLLVEETTTRHVDGANHSSAISYKVASRLHCATDGN